MPLKSVMRYKIIPVLTLASLLFVLSRHVYSILFFPDTSFYHHSLLLSNLVYHNGTSSLVFASYYLSVLFLFFSAIFLLIDTIGINLKFEKNKNLWILFLGLDLLFKLLILVFIVLKL